MISVVTNYLAMNAGRQFNIVSKDKNKSVERLSSGYKINRAADDAAGLSISEKMRHQIRNLNQACDNIQDGISLVHTADGIFEEITSMTKRINELCVQAANDTNDEDDRAAIDAEIQELKEEISDTLFNASFNTKRLFSEYYVPEVWGQPPTEDIQVYNDGLGGYGGISINNIRYTWSELGVPFNSDGTYCADTLFPPYGQRDSIRDPITNEAINLCFRAGERPPMASREYHWEATDDGIYVNKVFATSWEGLKGGFDKDDPQAGIYSFGFHGMTIRFATNEGDDFETIKQSINGQTPTYQNEIYWNASSLFSYDQHAVDIIEPTTSVRIHDTENAGGIYKYDYVDTENFYELRATATGVQLVDISNHGNDDFDTGGKHTFMPWSSFFDASGISSPIVPTSGNNPIIDWGKENKPNTLDYVTLDDSAVYRYTDQYTGITFDFKLTDEISLEQIRKGMTLSLGTIKTSLTAPIETKVNAIIPPAINGNHKITPYINESLMNSCCRLVVNSIKRTIIFLHQPLLKKRLPQNTHIPTDF